MSSSPQNSPMPPPQAPSPMGPPSQNPAPSHSPHSPYQPPMVHINGPPHIMPPIPPTGHSSMPPTSMPNTSHMPPHMPPHIPPHPPHGSHSHVSGPPTALQIHQGGPSPHTHHGGPPPVGHTLGGGSMHSPGPPQSHVGLQHDMPPLPPPPNGNMQQQNYSGHLSPPGPAGHTPHRQVAVERLRIEDNGSHMSLS